MDTSAEREAGAIAAGRTARQFGMVFGTPSGKSCLCLAKNLATMGQKEMQMPNSLPENESALASQPAGMTAVFPQKLPDRLADIGCVISMLGKGGAGKTSASIQLAGVAAHLGYRVLILDTDPQQSAMAWRALRNDKSIAVRACRQEQVEDIRDRAREAGFDIILVDNAPARTGASDRVAAVANLSLVMVRPSTLDLMVGLKWIISLKVSNCRFAVAINAAPAQRQGTEARFVRDARQALRQEASRVWRSQISQRHAVIQTTGTGRTLMEADPDRPAALEYCRLWNGLMTELARAP